MRIRPQDTSDPPQGPKSPPALVRTVHRHLSRGAGLALALLAVLSALVPLTTPASASPVPTLRPSIYQNFTVSGRVTVSGALPPVPIAGATVQANSGPSTTTDSNGNYTFVIPSGLETITYSANGFHRGSKTIFVKTDVTDVNVTLVPVTYTVSGDVLDSATHSPIAGATVIVEPGGTTLTTAADGSYSIPLANGTFELTVAESGYFSVSDNVTVAGAPVTHVFFLNKTTGGTSTTTIPPPYLIGAGVAALVVVGIVAFTFTRRRAKAAREREQQRSTRPVGMSSGSPDEVAGRSPPGR
jgi:hypothetical protein